MNKQQVDRRNGIACPESRVLLEHELHAVSGGTGDECLVFFLGGEGDTNSLNMWTWHEAARNG